MDDQQTRDQVKQHADAVVRGDMAAVVEAQATRDVAACFAESSMYREAAQTPVEELRLRHSRRWSAELSPPGHGRDRAAATERVIREDRQPGAVADVVDEAQRGREQ